MRKGFVVLLILNLMLLSSWEGLSFFHSLLHQIPNPFHHHGHQGNLPVYHHDYLDPQSSHSHSHSKDEAAHDLDDHLNLENDSLPDSQPADRYPLTDFFKLGGKLEKPVFEVNDFKLTIQKLTITVISASPFSSKGKPHVPPPKLV